MFHYDEISICGPVCYGQLTTFRHMEFYRDGALMVGLLVHIVWKIQKPSVSNTLANHAGLIVIDAIFRQITHLEDKEIIL